ncbi:STAS domain-containing protein [Streptomyces phaeoluteigriseus]|uniref:Anti-sigma factor antagonist n=1 Tax=Streptomyces phaeoluteigriseus TaxID=114686 RepID=A0ABY4ZB18_9ACTN|nr:STAS domain-containing protein [Streptomyces phaeoluteigriseus]USQ86233.1 STAS domain-containing protein [Streptomyces phaeoluteigriseus]
MTDTRGAARSGQLSVGQTAVDGIRVFTLRGEIDHTVKNVLSEALLCDLLGDDDAVPPRMVVDLSGVTFMDSSGINVFVAAYQAVGESRGWLRIAGAQNSVLRVLQVVGLDEVIPCHPTVEQALTA